MELVDGEPITDFCDQRSLSIDDRLRLFCTVCDALTYAHQHLVIHRDLKPSNILVTRESVPKLLDFGIAKLLANDEAELGQTIAEQRILTPDYASPEQLRGERLTTASDVYSLGVVLHELLTRDKPRRGSHGEFTRPSTLIRESRGVNCGLRDSQSTNYESRTPESRPHTSRVLQGDLDNIVLKALRAEPERRYDSAAQLAEDIRRHLARLPVIARRDTWRYRGAKFIQRHKLGVAAAAIAAIGVTGGLIVALWQAHVAELERGKAERRFAEGRKLAHAYLFDAHDAIERLPGSTAARASLVKHALEYLDGVSREARDDLSLQRELISAYLKVGNVQGNPTNANLGDTAGALASYRKALVLAEQLAQQSHGAEQRPVALVREKMADVLAASGNIPAALENAAQSLRIFSSLAASGDPVAQRSLAISHVKIGDLLGCPDFPNAGKPDEAIGHYRAAQSILNELHNRQPADQKNYRLLALTDERIGTVEELSSRLDEARRAFQQSAAIRENLAASSPDDSDIVRDEAIAYEKLADVLTDQDELVRAFEYRRRSFKIFRALAVADPQNAQAQQSLAISYMHLAELHGGPYSRNLGNAAEAVACYERSRELVSADSSRKSQDLVRDIDQRLALLRSGRITENNRSGRRSCEVGAGQQLNPGNRW